MSYLYGYLIGYGYLFFLILGVGGAFTRFGIKKEYSRKILHTLIGFTWLVLHFFFQGSPQVLVMPVSFVIINFMSYKFKWFSAIEREEDNHMGTVYYAMAMTVLMGLSRLFPETEMATGVAVFALSFGDGASALVGSALKNRTPTLVGKKTLAGTVACMLGSMAGVSLLIPVVGLKVSFSDLLLVGISTALLELIGMGLDNFSISFGVYGISVLAGIGSTLPVFEGALLLAWSLVLASAIALITAVKRSLTVGGALTAAVIIGVSLFFGGWACFGALVFSFVLITAVDKLVKRSTPEEILDIHKKTGPRDSVQVLVNGFAATFCAVLFFCTGEQMFAGLYFVAVTESLADSMASDVGVLSKGKTVDLCRFKSIKKGMSGGVSLLGTGAAILGALIMGVFSLIFFPFGRITLVIVLLPVAGVMFDSILGSVLQAGYRCTLCGALTEKTVHCGKRTVRYKGIPFVNNDMVNLLSGILTVLSGYGIWMWLC